MKKRKGSYCNSLDSNKAHPHYKGGKLVMMTPKQHKEAHRIESAHIKKIQKVYVLMEFYAVSEYSDELEADRIIEIYTKKSTAEKERKVYQAHADKEGLEHAYQVNTYELITR